MAESGLGTNVGTLDDWNRENIFTNIMMQARPWGTFDAAYDGKAPVGADGWPTGDAGTYTASAADQGIRPLDISGVYKAYWKGGGQLHASAPVGEHKVTGDTTFATITVPKGAPEMAVRWRGTQGGVRDVEIYRPGYDRGDVITREYLKLIEPFGFLRFMDFMRTNGNPTASWTERTRIEHGIQSGPFGPAYEYVAMIANASNKDAWICVPHLAADEPGYLEKLAGLMSNLLKPHLNVYVEFSNETWNSMFAQNWHSITSAEKEQAEGLVNYDYDPGNNPGNKWYWAWRRNGQQAVKIAKAMRPVLGERLRVMLCAQIGYGSGHDEFLQYKEALKFIAHTHGDPRKFIWGLGSGCYMGIPDDAKKPAITPIDVIRHLIEEKARWFFASAKGMAKLAAEYNLPGGHVAYEGGLDLMYNQSMTPDMYDARAKKLPTDISAPFRGIDNAHYLPQMGDFLKSMFKEWKASGSGAFCWYSTASGFGPYSWGITETPQDLDTPKYQAVQEAAVLLPAPQASNPDEYVYTADMLNIETEMLKGGEYVRGEDGTGRLWLGQGGRVRLITPPPGRYLMFVDAVWDRRDNPTPAPDSIRVEHAYEDTPGFRSYRAYKYTPAAKKKDPISGQIITIKDSKLQADELELISAEWGWNFYRVIFRKHDGMPAPIEDKPVDPPAPAPKLSDCEVTSVFEIRNGVPTTPKVTIRFL